MHRFKRATTGGEQEQEKRGRAREEGEKRTTSEEGLHIPTTGVL